MATFAIGDVQGCYDELRALLARAGFDATRDRLWFVGDLVNRGPKSLEVLRYVRDLGDRAVCVLGNHDLHLVCVFEGHEKARKGDTLDRVLDAPDGRELIDWLRARPMMHVEGDYAMVHAGLLPQWTIRRARSLAREVERALAASNYGEFLAHMYGSAPEQWDEALAGWDRLRVLVNAMTRMRFCTRAGQMDVRAKGREAPTGFLPWFEARPARSEPAIICGHWSTLGLRLSARLAALDTGCVWGGSLSALRLEDRALSQLACARHRIPGED
ncbi:MAG: symmetrical bis(5'-nucleosyl)-tetraphosphatase [Betaproteobacteria bacterium]|jgi:bis(5'-nucleosyl)-tetraphosphatase (symmetrical)|nr:symmetrical bis(5'-nucleosyl)-tetraphosphatase [Betaproteobacteria bacterium]